MEPVQEEIQGTNQVDMSQIDGTEPTPSGFQRMVNWVSRPRRMAILGGLILLLLMSVVVAYIPALKVPKPHVALSGEPIIAGGWLTNSLLTTFVVDIIIIVLALLATMGMKEVPGRWQSFVEMMVEYLYSLSESVAGRDARKYFPWVVTIFIFIVASNWIGLIPGVGSIVVHQTPAAEEHAVAFNRQIAMADGKLVLVNPAESEEGHGKEVPLFRAPAPI